jgi:type I restriction enzyme M protein
MAENLWDKYAVSNRDLEAKRAKTMKALDVYLSSLDYLP